MEQLTIFDLEEKPVISTGHHYLLVDGNNLLNRAFYATANNKPLTSPDGRPTNAVMSFMRMLFNYEKTYHAKAYVFFDQGKGFRKKLFPAYKDGRGEKPAELDAQFPIIWDVLSEAGIPFFKDEEYEADDLIACAAAHTTGTKFIISNDKDLLQLVSDDVSVVARKGSQDVVVTPELFGEMYNGLAPIQITDLKAIEGDSSDNIEGIVGIGEKGAMKIVQAMGDLKHLPTFSDWSEIKRYQKYFDEEGIKKALFFKDLTTLRKDRPLKLASYEMNTEGLRSICKTLELKSIIAMI